MPMNVSGRTSHTQIPWKSLLTVKQYKKKQINKKIQDGRQKKKKF